MLAEQENGLRSIVISLLLTPDDSRSGQQACRVTQFILDWLIGKRSNENYGYKFHDTVSAFISQ